MADQITTSRKTDTVAVKDIVSGAVVAACGDCQEIIEATVDDNGTWIECGCDAGYVEDNAKIRAVVMW